MSAEIFNPAFRGLLEKGFRYSFRSGPLEVPDEQTAIERGVNCGAFSRLFLLRLGFGLPQSLGPIEMYLPNTFLRRLEPEEPVAMGDLAFFGPSNVEGLNPALLGNQEAINLFIRSYPGIPHVAVFSGEYDPNTQESLYIHASYASRGVDVWPLNKFQEYRDPKGSARYSKLLEHKRPCTFRLAS